MNHRKLLEHPLVLSLSPSFFLAPALFAGNTPKPFCLDSLPFQEVHAHFCIIQVITLIQIQKILFQSP